MDGYIEWILPEAFPAGAFPDNKCLQVRSPVTWPTGQVEKINRTGSVKENKPKSYLERLYEAFPDDTIVADGNFIFKKEHWRNLRGKKQILVPIRNIPGVPMCKEAEDFNQSISAVRGQIERCFLIKKKFKRLTTKIPFKFDWCLLVHVFAAACALQNIAIMMPKANLNEKTKLHYFERVELEEFDAEVSETAISTNLDRKSSKNTFDTRNKRRKLLRRPSKKIKEKEWFKGE